MERRNEFVCEKGNAACDFSNSSTKMGKVALECRLRGERADFTKVCFMCGWVGGREGGDPK